MRPKLASPRTSAVRAIAEVLANGRSLNTSLASALDQVKPEDRALVQELVFGTCRWYFALLSIIKPLLHKPIRKKDQSIYIILTLGAYQLFFTRIPAHAAVNETVAVADEIGLSDLKKLANAILRELERQGDPGVAEMHKISHPEWMQAKLDHNWPEHSEYIFEQNNLRPPMTLRVNAQLNSADEYLEKLREKGIAARRCDFAASGLTLDKPCDVAELPGFEDGMASVQDEAAQLCTSILDLESGHKVLDACAAPGGKTCAMLEHNDLSMTALDSDSARSKRISDNLSRLGLNAELKVGRAEELDTWWDNQPFDRILLDAPCSATGVIRRHPDIKLLREEGDVAPLAALQLKILEQLWKTLASGGKLLYATCSVFPQENSRVIERFLKKETTAKLIPIAAEWGIDTGFGRQLFPQAGSHDGFFYSYLEKTN